MLVTFGNAGVQQTCEFFLYVQRLFGMRTNMLRFSSSVEVWSSKMRWNFLCSSERHTSSCELVKKYTLDSSSRRVLDLATCWLFLSQSQHYTNTTLRFCWSWTAPLTCCGYLQIRVIKRMIPRLPEWRQRETSYLSLLCFGFVLWVNTAVSSHCCCGEITLKLSAAPGCSLSLFKGQ